MLGRTLIALPHLSRAHVLNVFHLPALFLCGVGCLSLTVSYAPLALTPQGIAASLGYEALGFVSPAHGLTPASPFNLGWLNPGADLDASVSTDGEDIAAPVADIAEFRSKDAFLVVDSIFTGVATANAIVAGGAAVLSTSLVQDTF